MIPRRPRRARAPDHDRRSPLGAGLRDDRGDPGDSSRMKDAGVGAAVPRRGAAPPPRKRKQHRLVGGGQGHVLADPGRARLPQLHRQALLHPRESMLPGLRGRRPAGGQQIRLWLVVRLADDPQSGRDLPQRWCCASRRRAGPSSCRSRRAAVRAAARARRRGDRHPAGHQQRLYQARDRPAGRPAGGARRRGHPQRRPVQRGPLHDVDCRLRRDPTPTASATCDYRGRPVSAAPTARAIAACRSSPRRCPTGAATTRSTSG